MPRYELEIWLGCANRVGQVTARQVATLLEAKTIPRVRDLSLMNSEITDQLCRQLPESAIARRLHRLDLSMGTMTDAGAEALAEGARAFRKLDELVVDSNYLSESMARRLRGVAKRVRFGTQREPEVYNQETYRYIAVSE